MKFFSVGTDHYQIDQHGVVNQLHPKPFHYDSRYISTYDTPAYRKNSELLQALRFGFVAACHGRPVKSIIDTGYGAGDFMKFARQQVPEVYGIDVTGLPVPEGCLKIDDYLKVDVCTWWDVLEHIPDISFLKTLNCETVVISLPNCRIEEKGEEWFANEYPHRKPGEHIRHFSEDSLIATMLNYGWKCIAVSKHEDIIRKRSTEWNILTAGFKRLH